MHWRSKENTTDCGIFLMRHMETYLGKEENWDCGFQKKISSKCKCVIYICLILLFFSNLKLSSHSLFCLQDKAIHSLRAKYCSTILLNQLNKNRAFILKKAKEHLISK